MGVYSNIEAIIYADTREKFEEAKNDATRIGIIAQSAEFWANGAYYPLVYLDNYIKRGEAVDFATDLTGVVEASAEEFVCRPSAGEKSIRDKSAVIRSIKGNSIVWGQKLLPLTSDNWNQYSATYTSIAFADNAATVTLTASYTGQVIDNLGMRYKVSGQQYKSGHTYLLVGLCKLESAGKIMVDMSGTNYYSDNISASNVWTPFGVKMSLTHDAKTLYIKPPRAYTMLREGNAYSVRDVMLFDLGADYVTITPSEFRKVYNEAYYPYCDTTLRGVMTTAIKTTGFNLYNGTYARVLGGMSYVVSNAISASYTETIGGSRVSVSINDDGIYTPERTGYLYLVGLSDAICVHFQHSGVRDKECEPYVEHMLALPEILSLFPNGMHRVGDVYDEITSEACIRRCDYRDYIEGDEANPEVLTDGVHSVAKLATPIVEPLSEPITLDYYCEDWGMEEALSDVPSAAFIADIVYQFNAEGRIRDNSRNIDRLEKITAPLHGVPRDAALATEEFVIASMPTEIATATPRKTMVAGASLLSMQPNILYDWSGSTWSSIALPDLRSGDAAYDNKWMARVALGSSDNLTIPFTVLWKDGIAPSWNEWCVCDITFFKDPMGAYTCGEWKIYK